MSNEVKAYMKVMEIELEVQGEKTATEFWKTKAKAWQRELLRRGYVRSLYDKEYKFIRDFAVESALNGLDMKIDTTTFMNRLNASAGDVDPARVFLAMQEQGGFKKELMDTVKVFVEVNERTRQNQQAEIPSTSSWSFEDPADKELTQIFKEIYKLADFDEMINSNKIKKICKTAMKKLKSRTSKIQVNWTGAVEHDQKPKGEAEFKQAK